VSIPTIGIGAGPGCDAQVLVIHDLVGFTDGPAPKFVKRYADVRTQITGAAKAFVADVTSGAYPDDDHSYS
jgi:3-methyl-2-oxobutanoate hydroxymethyltransferase